MVSDYLRNSAKSICSLLKINNKIAVCYVTAILFADNHGVDLFVSSLIVERFGKEELPV